jgi:hypothetical protein
MLHPSQFQVNEAWIAFKLNDAPIQTDRDGDFNFFALMDAASCYLLSSTTVPATAPEPSLSDARRLLTNGQEHKKQLPQKLFIPLGYTANLLAAEAERHGITIVRVPEGDLQVFIGEAREGFKSHFSGGSMQ